MHSPCRHADQYVNKAVFPFACLDVAFSALRSFVFCVGALPLLVAFLAGGRAEAYTALQILYYICSFRTDPGGHFADLLARLQGARQVSNVLCTVQFSRPGRRAAAGVVISITCRCKAVPHNLI